MEDSFCSAAVLPCNAWLLNAGVSSWCVLPLPTYATGAQTKETLSLRATSFGSKCELSDKFIKKVADSGVADGVLSFATFKQNKDMKKTDGAKRQRITGAALPAC